VSRFDQNRRIAFLRPRYTAPYPDLPGDAAKGTCIPPYFVFQFRVDGQPSSFGDPNPNGALPMCDELYRPATDDIWPTARFVDTKRKRFMIPQAPRDLDVPKNVLRRWTRADPTQAFRGHCQMPGTASARRDHAFPRIL
jgi:hypothetical protein